MSKRRVDATETSPEMVYSRGRATLAVVQAVACLTLAGCGGGGDAADDSQFPQSDEQELEPEPEHVHALAAPANSTWVTIATEGNSFSFSGTKTVRYGVDTRWVQKSVTNGGKCTNTFFGKDPAYGVRKFCQTLVPTYSAIVSWTAPVVNTDGTPLTDVNGYVISYGTSPTGLTKSMVVSDPGLTTGTVSNLAAGTYYFSIVTRNSTGTSSTASTVVSKTVP